METKPLFELVAKNIYYTKFKSLREKFPIGRCSNSLNGWKQHIAHVHIMGDPLVFQHFENDVTAYRMSNEMDFHVRRHVSTDELHLVLDLALQVIEIRVFYANSILLYGQFFCERSIFTIRAGNMVLKLMASVANSPHWLVHPFVHQLNKILIISSEARVTWSKNFHFFS